MQRHLILRAKIQELEEAVREAVRLDDPERVRFYNAELVPLLIRLVDAVGTPEPNFGTDC